ncbi:glycoside hydrolase [Leucosporidium creatinivorum]|uniref:alpha-1,2-Mannosidase n=1 Tax=Leucosporidium creatinivorum TaxID=106004 RepID=A0A1Y2FZW5_9BASI|nr:glycoside hydrolase [Leucosporidium creatinivorum]
MAPKRKDAKAKATPATAPPSTGYSPSQLDAKATAIAKPLAVWVRLAFRLFCLVSVGLYLWPQLFPKKEQEAQLQQEDLELGGGYEPIELDAERRAAVLEAFKHSYGAYERDAFGFDDYHPISHKGSNMSPKGPVGYFVVDSLDSLLIMGLNDEYKRARDWVKDLSFDIDDKFHNFEITIRVLGGLLSAFSLSEDPIFLEKAIDLADRLLPVFDTPSGLPMSFINLHKREGILDQDNRNFVSVAEAGTLQLELKYLSEISGNPIYWQKAEKVIDIIREQPNKDGLVPIFMSPDTGSFVMSEIRLGSRADSYYEYLSKMYLQTNRTEAVYKEMHELAMGGIKQHLLKSSVIKNLMYTSELMPRRDRQTGQFALEDIPKQDHLVCFLAASLMLGVTDGTGPVPPDTSSFTDDQQDDFFAGKALLRTCVNTYVATKTGLAPEIVNFHTDALHAKKDGREWFINSRARAAPNTPIDARNILRPETVESLFVAYRITGDPVYRKWGWDIFQAFVKHCRLPEGGFASIYDVDEVPVRHEDRMETFWISETLKYLYLLFSEDTLVPLDKYVFNTEAHVLPIFTPTVKH